MKYLLCFLCISCSFSNYAALNEAEIIEKVHSISKLYGDGFATLVSKSLRTKTLKDSKGNCVSITSFHMEGFAEGNNAAQFIVFINCHRLNGNPESTQAFAKNVIGIHPFYQHRNTYDVDSAEYNENANEITISSPKGLSYFIKSTHSGGLV
jgi:hypothetical protein